MDQLHEGLTSHLDKKKGINQHTPEKSILKLVQLQSSVAKR